MSIKSKYFNSCYLGVIFRVWLKSPLTVISVYRWEVVARTSSIEIANEKWY